MAGSEGYAYNAYLQHVQHTLSLYSAISAHIAHPQTKIHISLPSAHSNFVLERGWQDRRVMHVPPSLPPIFKAKF